MDNASYVALTRQSGLLREMRVVANNIANANTTGFRREMSGYSEYLQVTGTDQPSLSMAKLSLRAPDLTEAELVETGAKLDLAIEGQGFFLIEGQDGLRVTRAGSFSVNSDSELVTHDGLRVLDAGGGPLFIPPDAADISITGDGTIQADGQLIGQVGVVQPADTLSLRRVQGTAFRVSDFDPAENATLRQGFLEGSNVNPILEVTRMIEVQRAYELGQKLLDQEHQRIRNVSQTLSK